eukprot:scaffold55407_cov48-Phaeocystis_antarctica.AAC.1
MPRFFPSSPDPASKLSPPPAVPGQVRLGPRARLLRLLTLQVRRAACRGAVARLRLLAVPLLLLGVFE